MTVEVTHCVKVSRRDRGSGIVRKRLVLPHLNRGTMLHHQALKMKNQCRQQARLGSILLCELHGQ